MEAHLVPVRLRRGGGPAGRRHQLGAEGGEAGVVPRPGAAFTKSEVWAAQASPPLRIGPAQQGRRVFRRKA